MSQPYLGEIRMFGGNFAPLGWAFCDGQLLAISQYDALYNLLGTTYGGDGMTSFALPDLRGRIPIHAGNGSTGSSYTLGETGGVETVTLTTAQLPQHVHPLGATAAQGSQSSPSNGVFAATDLGLYTPGPRTATMHTQAIGLAGGNQPHDNLMPHLAINFIIALEGLYPSQT